MTRFVEHEDFFELLENLPDVDPKESRFVEAEQEFQESVRADIDWLMKHKKVSRKDLAERLGVSRPAVSKMLNQPNLTLKRVARIFNALDEVCELTSPTLRALKSAARARTVKSIRMSETKTSNRQSDENLIRYVGLVRNASDVRKWVNTTKNDNVRDEDVGAIVANA
tara:strand:+ start:334 stop:837 length:504 start_codon:yes stop_codon:yes gene_type:complete